MVMRMHKCWLRKTGQKGQRTRLLGGALEGQQPSRPVFVVQELAYNWRTRRSDTGLKGVARGATGLAMRTWGDRCWGAKKLYAWRS